MIPDPVIWRAASALLKRHGKKAAQHASMTADEHSAGGDSEGAKFWRRIVAAIEKLERQKPQKGEAVH